MKRELLERSLAHADYIVGLLQMATNEHACADGKPAAARFSALSAAKQARREIIDALQEDSLAQEL